MKRKQPKQDNLTRNLKTRPTIRTIINIWPSSIPKPVDKNTCACSDLILWPYYPNYWCELQLIVGLVFRFRVRYGLWLLSFQRWSASLACQRIMIIISRPLYTLITHGVMSVELSLQQIHRRLVAGGSSRALFFDHLQHKRSARRFACEESLKAMK